MECLFFETSEVRSVSTEVLYPAKEKSKIRQEIVILDQQCLIRFLGCLWLSIVPATYHLTYTATSPQARKMAGLSLHMKSERKQNLPRTRA